MERTMTRKFTAVLKEKQTVTMSPPLRDEFLNAVIADYAIYGSKWHISVPPPEPWADNFGRLVCSKIGKDVDKITLLPISSMYAKQIEKHGKIIDFSVPEEFVSVFSYFNQFN